MYCVLRVWVLLLCDRLSIDQIWKHTFGERALIHFISFMFAERNFSRFIYTFCISNVRRRVSSATTVTRRYIQISLGGHIFFRVFSFQHSLAGDQCSTFLVLSAFVLLTKKPSTHTSCVLFPLDQVDDVSHNTNNNFLGSRRKWLFLEIDVKNVVTKALASSIATATRSSIVCF